MESLAGMFILAKLFVVSDSFCAMIFLSLHDL